MNYKFNRYFCGTCGRDVNRLRLSCSRCGSFDMLPITKTAPTKYIKPNCDDGYCGDCNYCDQGDEEQERLLEWLADGPDSLNPSGR